MTRSTFFFPVDARRVRHRREVFKSFFKSLAAQIPRWGGGVVKKRVAKKSTNRRTRDASEFFSRNDPTDQKKIFHVTYTRCSTLDDALSTPVSRDSIISSRNTYFVVMSRSRKLTRHFGLVIVWVLLDKPTLIYNCSNQRTASESAVRRSLRSDDK